LHIRLRQEDQARSGEGVGVIGETPPWSQQAEDAAAHWKVRTSPVPDQATTITINTAQRDQEATMGRHERRVDLARFRRDASRRDLLTFLVPPDDAALATAPLLQRTARNWIDLLDQRVRHCIICSKWIVDRQSVGLLLLATPATAKPTTASACGVCRECAELPLPALERAATTALQAAVPGGRLAPLDAP
jgi:hypothetical protein